MSIVGEVIAKLKAISPAPFALVEGIVELAAVKGRPLALPAAYVFVRQEQAGPNQRMTGPVLQPLELDIAVVIITENLSSDAALGEDLEVLKDKARGALLGMVPAQAQDGTPLEYVSGEVVRLGGGVVWHESVFSASIFVTEASAADEDPDDDEELGDDIHF